MKARRNVIVVKLDKWCNLVFVRPKSDIHGYVFFIPENLSTIFLTKFWTEFFKQEIMWLVQKKNQAEKKFGPICVKKLISYFDLTFFWQKLDQIFFQLDSIFGLTRWFIAWKKWVRNFVQKMVNKFSIVKKTYPWMSDFGLTKTKLHLLSSFTTITFPLAFILIWYLPYYVVK